MYKLSSREKRLLYILLVVAMVSAFVLALRYFNGQIDESKAKLTELQQMNARIAAACETVDNTKLLIPELKRENESIASRFKERLTNPYIDDIITVTGRNSGLTPYTLTIGETLNTPISPFGFGAESEQTGGLFYVCRVTFTASGREGALKSFIDAVAADRSLRICEFSHTGYRNGNMQMMFIIDVYMLDASAAALQ